MRTVRRKKGEREKGGKRRIGTAGASFRVSTGGLARKSFSQTISQR